MCVLLSSIYILLFILEIGIPPYPLKELYSFPIVFSVEINGVSSIALYCDSISESVVHLEVPFWPTLRSAKATSIKYAKRMYPIIAIKIKIIFRKG